MELTYIIIDDDQESVLKTQEIAERFKNLTFVASANTYDDGLNLILEHQPRLVFLEIEPSDKKSKLSLGLINELYRYLKVVPKIIITTKGKQSAYDALQYEVIDYLLKPININEFRKSILKLDKALSMEAHYSVKESVETFEVLDEALELKESQEIGPKAPKENDVFMLHSNLPPKDSKLIICIKSYGDYRYIDSGDILYFAADNNSTDIHLNNGEMITAFKTLKHFESVLPKAQFLRIHNSYIINVNQVSRIHTGNTVCYIKNSTIKLPFSKSYKENVDLIISRIAGGNYLEI